MTDPLTAKEKKEKKAIRKQQKAASKTMKTFTQPKHEEPPAQPVNLCDDCAYEFGECGGKPKFASDQDETLTGAEANRVIECPAFINVAAMPTADQVSKQAAAQGPAAAEEQPKKGRRICDVEHLRDYPDCFEDCPKDECDGVPDAAHDGGDKGPMIIENETQMREFAGAVANVIRTDLPEQPDPNRFQAEKDFGACPSCDSPLKLTAFNRYQDAIRCVNPRCRAYRAIVKTISTGVK